MTSIVKFFHDKEETKEIYDYQEYEIKKYINSILKIKDKEKRIEKLSEVLNIYVEEFQILSDTVVSNFYTNHNMNKKLFLSLFESITDLNDRCLNLDKLDELINFSDYEIDKIRKRNIKNKYVLTNITDTWIINSYFDKRDALEYCLNSLKELVESKTDSRKREFALKEYFIIAFSIFSNIDDLFIKMNKSADRDTIELLKNTLNSIYIKINECKNKNRKFKLLKLI